jgi:hypothetical protein
VDVDGSGIALSAVPWATREAQRRGAPLLGSTSHTVLRHSPCPVVVVKRGTPLTGMAAEATAIATSAPPAPVVRPTTPERWTLHVPDRRQRR